MYLKALEIQGFKSFPDKTRLTFEKDITAIVGPNGSGKSNISDAILWVMGEQRSKALRGGKMEDVIFGGTEKRGALGFAQVSLIIDNSKGIFKIDTPEVMITRRYYRTGDSEYYLNREAVRLKDITDLLMDTGLGRDGYSVIGQGRIAEIVSAKSSDRREIFEEAAGISRYRHRKEEAERRLARTEENLLRINDKIEELHLQVEPLEKQAETAKKFLILRDEQRLLEVSVCMENLDSLRVRAERINKDHEYAKQNLDKAQAELNGLYAASDNYQEKMRECDVELERLREKLSFYESEAAECDSSVAVLNANLLHNSETIERVRGEMDEQNARVKSIETQIAELEARMEEIAGEKTAFELDVRSVLRQTEENAEINGANQRELAEIVALENSRNEALAQCSTMLTMLKEQREECLGELSRVSDEISRGEVRFEELGKQIRTAQAEKDSIFQRMGEITNVINGHKMLMNGRENAVKELSDRLNELTVETRSAEGRIRMLRELEKEYEGLGKAVKTVMREVSRGTLRGIYGPVAKLLKTEDEYTLAIETALGGAMQNIVVEDQKSGKAAIEMLKRTGSGRGTFLPIDTIRPGFLKREPKGEEGYLGIAASLVQYDAKYENIFKNLLGRTAVVETLADAVRIAKKYNNEFRIVSLDGQLINVGGSMTGGSAAKNVGILSRANELAKLQVRYEQLKTEEDKCGERLGEAQRVLTSAKYEMEVASGELMQVSETFHRSESALEQLKLMRSNLDESLEDLDGEKLALSKKNKDLDGKISACEKEEAELSAQLRDIAEKLSQRSRGMEEFERRRDELLARLTELREKIASLDAERETTRRSAESLRELISVIGKDEQERVRHIEELEARCLDIRAEIDVKNTLLSEKNESIGHCKSEIEKKTALRLELEGKRTSADKAGQDKNRELLDLQGICVSYEQKKISAEMEEKQIIDKLWDSYELSRSAAGEIRQPVENMSAATKRISELKREISRLGNVNVGAIAEYERVSERYNFLTEQRDDVDKAKRDLQKIISDIASEMKEIFTREFKAIDESFRKVFLDLFGGGKARLELEDEENVLECGIDIKVQPPGKAVTTISLLSGGEKAYVAIALYFAIMKIRPTPFCIMDEVEAALDEANVVRTAQYMRSLADNTQFIVITHRRGTMEEADILYGVTMQEKGVTTVLSVDLEEAERTLG